MMKYNPLPVLAKIVGLNNPSPVVASDRQEAKQSPCKVEWDCFVVPNSLLYFFKGRSGLLAMTKMRWHELLKGIIHRI